MEKLSALAKHAFTQSMPSLVQTNFRSKISQLCLFEISSLSGYLAPQNFLHLFRPIDRNVSNLDRNVSKLRDNVKSTSLTIILWHTMAVAIILFSVAFQTLFQMLPWKSQ